MTDDLLKYKCSVLFWQNVSEYFLTLESQLTKVISIVILKERLISVCQYFIKFSKMLVDLLEKIDIFIFLEKTHNIQPLTLNLVCEEGNYIIFLLNE